jgi:glycosidase
MLNFTKKLITLRKENPALRRGDFLPMANCPRGMLAYLRRTKEQTILVALNFTDRHAVIEFPTGEWRWLYSTTRTAPADSNAGQSRLAPHEVRLWAMS